MYSNLVDCIIKGKEKIAVVGLGYVGMPLAVAFSKVANVIGYDNDKEKILKYKLGEDLTGEVGDGLEKNCRVELTNDEVKLSEALFFIIAVPTPINDEKLPDLTMLENASRIVGKYLSRGSVVVYESTVYPGATEEICIPILEEESGFKCGKDFKVGYSPERINPGDKQHKLQNIVKIVSGIDGEAREIISKIYQLIIKANVYEAESIKVAEAAKVVENCQRDLNIAFMNELSILFNKMGIDTKEVLAAAKTKWNFCEFYPGLVGGHCIGIDPYYLIYKAGQVGYDCKIVKAGREMNESMGGLVVNNLLNLIKREGIELDKAVVGILGITFKEDCLDVRNSKTINIIRDLEKNGVHCLVADGVANAESVKKEYGIELVDHMSFQNLDAIILAVPHEMYSLLSESEISRMYKENHNKILMDVKGAFDKAAYENLGYIYWRM